MPSLSSAMQLRTAGTAIDKGIRIELARRRVSMMSPCGQGAQLSFRTRGRGYRRDFRVLRMPVGAGDEPATRTRH